VRSAIEKGWRRLESLFGAEQALILPVLFFRLFSTFFHLPPSLYALLHHSTTFTTHRDIPGVRFSTFPYPSPALSALDLRRGSQISETDLRPSFPSLEVVKVSGVGLLALWREKKEKPRS
jgi:hypothetical protein